MANNPQPIQSKVYVRITRFWWTHAKCIEKFFWNEKEKTFMADITSGNNEWDTLKCRLKISENTAANLYHNFPDVKRLDSPEMRALKNVEYDAKIDEDELFYYDRIK